jgi:hypothetical protein
MLTSAVNVFISELEMKLHVRNKQKHKIFTIKTHHKTDTE